MAAVFFTAVPAAAVFFTPVPAAVAAATVVPMLRTRDAPATAAIFFTAANLEAAGPAIFFTALLPAAAPATSEAAPPAVSVVAPGEAARGAAESGAALGEVAAAVATRDNVEEKRDRARLTVCGTSSPTLLEPLPSETEPVMAEQVTGAAESLEGLLRSTSSVSQSDESETKCTISSSFTGNSSMMARAVFLLLLLFLGQLLVFDGRGKRSSPNLVEEGRVLSDVARHFWTAAFRARDEDRERARVCTLFGAPVEAEE